MQNQEKQTTIELPNLRRIWWVVGLMFALGVAVVLLSVIGGEINDAGGVFRVLFRYVTTLVFLGILWTALRWARMRRKKMIRLVPRGLAGGVIGLLLFLVVSHGSEILFLLAWGGLSGILVLPLYLVGLLASTVPLWQTVLSVIAGVSIELAIRRRRKNDTII